jgi:hypothetical protein
LRWRRLARGRRRTRLRVASVWLGLCAAPSLSWADDAAVAGAKEAVSVTFDCAGRTSDGTHPSFASGGEAKFEVSATFGEGAIVALVDPESSAVLKPVYDAETAIGHLGFSDGEEATIVWTRMSGADGALMGEAIMSDGDVLALTIDPASQGTTERPFTLFAGATSSLIRGPCALARPRR